MTPEEIEEGNKLIAEFMLLKFHKIGWIDNHHIDGNYECEELKYHSSWDWLMPVMEKIEDVTNCSPSINFGIGTTIHIDGINAIKTSSIIGHESPLSMTYRAVVEFIKWDNQQK